RAALAQARADSEEQTRAQAAQAQAGLAQMRAELAQTRAELVQTQAGLAQTDAALRQMRAALAQAEADLQQARDAGDADHGRVQSMQRSASWRLTLPLRILQRALSSSAPESAPKRRD
ncbi:MAG: hypothetical protein JO295_08890, partial [Verrucomicrobia bacterium]|nr:hypothetical protein [Verrucomicrobiota bacterium]